MTDMSTDELRIERIDTRPGMGRGLIYHDPMSKLFRAVPRGADLPLRDRTWRRGLPYDQGNTSSCVAQTAKGILNTALMSAKLPYYKRSHLSTDYIYAMAQQNDEWPGEAYDGTSALGAMKALADTGIIKEYRWCFGVQDVLQTLSNIGPVGIGINWKSGMWDTDGNGFIHATGPNEGGHEVELIGIDLKERCVIGMNSWGQSWGVKGRFKLSWDDLGVVLDDSGDAVVVVA
jgi:hypothetical protein